MNKIKINLFGKEYTIQTDESVGYVKQLAEALDEKIEEYMSQNDTISLTSACMLVALSLMDDCMKASSDKDNLRKQIIDYLEDATKARNEISELKKQVDVLTQQNEMMSVKLSAYEGDRKSNNAKK
ncbi:MAG: cell division protein ZapA [Oscillospiraceae bacterium]